MAAEPLRGRLGLYSTSSPLVQSTCISWQILVGTSGVGHVNRWLNLCSSESRGDTLQSSARVYVALLDEGVEVWRPADAEPLGDGLYRLTGPVPDTEIWRFPLGSVVHCEPRTFEDGNSDLVAVEEL